MMEKPVRTIVNLADLQLEYPDSGRIAIDVAHGNDKQPPSIFSTAGRLSPQGYWEGEDIGEEK